MPAGTGEQRHLRRFTILYIKKQSAHYRILKSHKDTLHGPSDWIRTSGLLNPIQARYQTSLHPDFILPRYHSTSGRNLQALFWLFSDFSRGRSDDGSRLRVGGPGIQILARGREHELDAVELVDLGCAGVIVHGDDIGLGIGAAQGLDDALADDVVW